MTTNKTLTCTWYVLSGKYVLETGQMSGSNTFVFSAKRRGSSTPVVCKFFSDQESFRREMKFFERVHTGDFVPGQFLQPCCISLKMLQIGRNLQHLLTPLAPMC